MLFKLFVFLRLPVSVLALAGLAVAIGSQSTVEFGAFVGECLLAYLVFTTAYLARLMPGALQLAGWLLLLETVGAVLFVGYPDMAAGRNLDKVAIWAGVVLLLWALPNALLFYSQRGKFVGQEKKTPGL